MTVWLLRDVGRLFTGTGAGVIQDALVCVDGDRVAWVGSGGAEPPEDLRRRVADVVDAEGGLVTPGLIDAHTHPVYAGDRHAEVAARSAGLSYGELGGDTGIPATVATTRAAGADDLERGLVGRLRSWLRAGTTTVEAKTGYHLDHDGELAATRLLARLADDPSLPRLSVTFLAAHALPAEAAGDWDAYARQAAGWSADAADAGAVACDAFCDTGYFTVAQSREVLLAGRAAGLVPRVHADELEHTGGAALAAEVGAASADHLLHVTPADARRLAAAGVVATLCPGTAMSIGTTPDVAALRAAGVHIALGSDHNPGTCGITSMSLVVALAVAALGLSVHEALLAATRGGARSLRMEDRGTVRPGSLADLVWWPAEHEGALAWGWGLRPRTVWRAGEGVAGDAGP
ncbi:MAG: imidazolonepropionase [Actinobacteria bacterium]|nr:imidazolonepropionase [Actinomycetota bacterium]